MVNEDYLLLIHKFFEKTKEGLNRTTFDVKINGELKDCLMSSYGEIFQLNGMFIQTAKTIIANNETYKDKYDYQISLRKKYKCEGIKLFNPWVFLIQRLGFLLFKNGKCTYFETFTKRQRNRINCFDYTFDGNNYYLIPNNEKEIIHKLILKERDLLDETENFYNSTNFTSFHYYADPSFSKINDRLSALNKIKI
jgi:hypothetical protein